MKSDNKILTLSFDFALSVVWLYKKHVEKKEFIISKQPLRSATSIGANVEEALAAQSRRDFVSKMSIASKEARESRYWLRLLATSKMIAFDYHPFLNSIEQIINILTKIVKTTQSSPLIQNSKFII